MAEFDVEFKSSEGLNCCLTFQNAPVAMPIWSIGEINEAECETTFRKDDGVIKHIPSNDQIHFIKRAGVYFVKMLVPRQSVNPPDEVFGRHGPTP